MKEQTFATYEEYKSATKFARWKYKYGLFVLIACWICLVLLIGFIWIYQEELSTHPALYTIDKMNLDYCNCYGEDMSYYINSTAVVWSRLLG